MYQHVFLQFTKSTGFIMKKIVIVYVAAMYFMTACNNSSADKAATDTAQQASAQTGKSFEADTAASSVHWRATHKGGFAPRYGTISISNGDLSAENGTVTGGEFTININSLVVDTASVTEKDKKASDLQGHLKSPDFFNAEKYPTAKFVITKVAPYDSASVKSELPDANSLVSGNLTLKDSTVNITFPAKISVSDNNIDVAAKFMVDRTAWGLNWKTEGDPGNWVVSKDFELDLNLKAASK